MDRNPATPSKKCPKCGEFGFRLGIHTFFIQHYYCYCKFCNYETEHSPSENIGHNEWFSADNNIT